MRRLALACVATVAVADCVLQRKDLSWFQVGLLDEPAHLATGILVGGLDPVFLAGAMLPDADHLPLVLQDPRPGDPRPGTHSVYLAALAALVSRRLAAGVLTHFARDLALPPGVPLLGGSRHFRVPYAAYAVLLLASAYSRSRPC